MSKSMVYQNSQYLRVMNMKYKEKTKKLKRKIKQFVFENGGLNDEVAQIQTELYVAREERRYLIKRLLRYEGVSANNVNGAAGEDEKETTAAAATDDTIAANNCVNSNETQPVPKKRGPKKQQKVISNATTTTNTNNANMEENRTEKQSSKAARDKIILDANGKPQFPINLCTILIHSPGEIISENNVNFHNEHWIYPVGYVATRIYAHPSDPQRKCVFTCKILNNAGMPQFQIIPDNDLDGVFFGETANKCHQALIDAIKCSLTDTAKLSLHVQGEKFFGLANPKVQSLLEIDAGFKRCANFKGFEIVEENDAFIIPDDQDPAMNYDALQLLITMSAFHHMPEVKEEPPDELFE